MTSGATCRFQPYLPYLEAMRQHKKELYYCYRRASSIAAVFINVGRAEVLIGLALMNFLKHLSANAAMHHNK